MWIVALSAALALAQAPAAPTETQANPNPNASASAVTAAKPTPEAKPEKPKKPKLVCTEEGQIGSLMTKRVCRTPKTIEAEQRTAQSILGSCQGQGC